ncbi:MAG: iron-sulfur cluster assembly scaffold protein [Candidatus Woykebacteria bacterium]
MLEDQLYRQELLDIIRNPSNRGEIAKPDLEARLVNPLCGDEIKLQLKLSNNQELRTNNQKVEKATFSGNGCAISQASASLLAEYIEGKNLEEVRKLNSSDILGLIGINSTPSRLGCALLSLEVLRKAIAK